jgi:hypothetical protein
MKPAIVDATQRSAVVVCTHPGCGARDVTLSRRSALLAVAAHYDVAHPDDTRSADQLRRRAAATRR